jgi:CheY-like chemotaxis protein
MISGLNREVTILIVEDDDGHAELIRDNLQEAGLVNPIIRLSDGQAALDFLFGAADSTAPRRQNGQPYMMLLDIRMPRVDGVEVLRRIKGDPQLRKMPVIMLTTTEDPREIENCYSLGCSWYVTKPIDYLKFSKILKRIALFIMVVQMPQLNRE